VDAAYNKSREANHPFYRNATYELDNLHAWRKTGIALLASTPNVIFTAILGGSLLRRLVRSKAEDKELCGYFDESDTVDEKHHQWAKRKTPIEEFALNVYMREYVSKNGKSPTSNMLQYVIVMLRYYVSGMEVHYKTITKINSQSKNKSTPEEIKKRLHHYLARI
jgi:hypothetical protein